MVWTCGESFAEVKLMGKNHEKGQQDNGCMM